MKIEAIRSKLGQEEGKMEMKEIQAIDFWVALMYYNGKLAREYFKYYEFRIMAIGTFAGVAKKMGLKPGEEWKVLGGLSKSSVEEMVAEMDEIGVEHAIIVAAKVWSWREQRLMMDTNIDEIADICKKTDGRVMGAASYISGSRKALKR